MAHSRFQGPISQHISLDAVIKSEDSEISVRTKVPSDRSAYSFSPSSA